MTLSKLTLIKTFLATLILLSIDKVFACSTYKVTVNGSTMYGINYDTWLNYPRIWFETKGIGAAFTGANDQGVDGFSPQAGMNVFGLSFGTLATTTPENGTASPNKKTITSRTNYLKNILHTCKTVDEVKAYIEQYDHSSLSNDVFFYTDKSGKYLIVEPYKLTLGNENSYVLANFCPSTIKNFSTIKQERYIKGTAFLKNKIDTSLAFCTALSDTMHVCRKKIGDGTLLTSIWDLNGGVVHLYFYHDYTHEVQFNLSDELAKGNHSFEIPTLFPSNKEYQKLLDFKTPLNSKPIDLFLRFCFVLFLFSALFFLINFFRKRASTPYGQLKLVLFALNLMLMYYVFILASEINIFYSPVPYKDYKFSLLNVAAYIPFLLLMLIIPLFRINFKIFRENDWSHFSKWLFIINNLTYLTLIILLAYWGLFNIFN